MPYASPISGNIERASAAMRSDEVGAVVSFRHEDVAYLIGPKAFIYRVMTESRASEGVVFVLDREPIVVTMDAYVPYYRSVGVRAEGMSGLDRLVERLRTEAQGKVSIPGDIPSALRERVVEKLAKDQVTGRDPLRRARIAKGPDEVAAIRAACAITEVGMVTALEACEPGVTEYEAAARAEQAMRSHGADGFCFSTMVITGPELGVMREVTSSRVMVEGDWVLIDLGCTKDGYNAEFARSRFLGKPTDEFWDAYETVVQAQRSAIEAVRPGVRASEVDGIAHQVIASTRFAPFSYSHITGHGIGTGVWEQPFIGPDNGDELVEGMVLAIEPGIFIPNVGGIRIEDLVVVTRDGHEFITTTPLLRDLPLAPTPGRRA
jgi:Xaa-Pro aminopeptidase